MKIGDKQLESVLALPGRERFEYFVKKVADWQSVWGLYQDGWALAATGEGTQVFPVWPAFEFARGCADHDWLGYEPREIALDEFMEILLPKLKADGVLVGVFFTPSGKGLALAVDDVQSALAAELRNY